MSLADKLTRENIQQLVPYASARRSMTGGNIWLNANESPYANEYELDCSVLNRYPDFQPKGLIQSYAAYAGVKPSQVLAGRGADEAIELLIRTFCEDDEQILICPPTYGMYAISAQTCNIDCKKVPTKADFSLDIDAIQAAKDNVKVVFICSPNNPTGTLVSHQQIEQVLEIFKDQAIVAVDEAYIEYAMDTSVASWIEKYDNLAVLRTMSKAFGLAGLRCGYTLANENIIQAMSKVIPPYPVSWPVAQIATQALSESGLALMQQQKAQVLEQKQRIVDALARYDYVYEQIESHSNFIMFRSEQKKALFDTLVQAGILIRDYSSQVLLDNSLRISVGSKEETDALLAVMDEFKG
ncbi:histidinol-phosphate aminotransferase [Catenovulum agarivorans DS-2]|uniref:Histidinol-phosphate aminotransferase n=1 Tax=Catenovulum agarivorans DS-2 TaxID=1328313 RepID=W7QL11_9ALTE|nr:histidinol-phosphate transaminase [Catenovulum agarivorans]EWH09622.1 histidinol-phosphate aminotransferase [Catenovulum agarivorans DS-2]